MNWVVITMTESPCAGYPATPLCIEAAYGPFDTQDDAVQVARDYPAEFRPHVMPLVEHP